MAIPLIGAILPIIDKVLEKVIPNVAEREKVKMELQIKMAEQEGRLLEALVQSDVAQAEINKADALSGDKFKSYARPTAMWICVLGFAWVVFLPLVKWTLACFNLQTPDIPQLDSPELTSMTFGLLGLGGMRSYEKKIGVTK